MYQHYYQQDFRAWARARIKMHEAELKKSPGIFDAAAHTGHIDQLRCALKMLHLYESDIEQKRMAARISKGAHACPCPHCTTP